MSKFKTKKMSDLTECLSKMMHGAGDVADPLPETVALVEKIVIQQIEAILKLADTHFQRRKGAKQLEVMDIIFLMRRNAHGLRRLQRMYELRSMGFSLTGAQKPNKTHVKQYEKLRQAVEIIDITGELSDLSVKDPVKLKRLLRANVISENLSVEEYETYVTARHQGFTQTLLKTFIDAKLDKDVWTLLEYIGLELVLLLINGALDFREWKGIQLPLLLDPITGDTGDPLTKEDIYNSLIFLQSSGRKQISLKLPRLQKLLIAIQ